MSTGYNKTAWQDGDIITADKMNNIENGIKDVEDTIGELKENLSDLQEVSDTKAAAIYETASGEIASFSDGADDLPMKSAVVTMEPIQDLHGYDHPWPAGGGKNLFYHEGDVTASNNGVTATFNSDTQSITISGTNTSTSAYILLTLSITSDVPRETPLCRALINAPSGAYLNFAYRKNRTWYAVNNGGVVPEDTDADAPINMQIGISGTATTISQTVMYIELEKGSTAPTAYEPYSNICPISGRTGLSVVRSGKNLLDKASYKFLSSMNIVWGAVSSNKWADGSLTLEAGTYVFSCSTIVSGIYIGNQTQNISTRYNVSNITFTLSQKTPIKILIYKDGSSSEELSGMDYQLELGSTATDYEPYKGNTYSVNWETEAGTVYGGTLDVVSGKLTVLGVKDTLTVVDGQLLSQLFIESASKPITVLGDNVRTSFNRRSQTSNMNTISSSYNAKMANLCQHYFAYAADTPHWYINNQLYLYLPKADVGETFESYKTFLQDNPFEVYIPFATPTEIQLTPQEVRTLLGENNIWSDSGDVEVEYAADTKLYIEKLTAPTEDDMIADHAISANSFFMVGNTLYRATTAIASGATITVGTNAVKLSLSDALNALA